MTKQTCFCGGPVHAMARARVRRAPYEGSPSSIRVGLCCAHLRALRSGDLSPESLLPHDRPSKPKAVA